MGGVCPCMVMFDPSMNSRMIVCFLGLLLLCVFFFIVFFIFLLLLLFCCCCCFVFYFYFYFFYFFYFFMLHLLCLLPIVATIVNRVITYCASKAMKMKLCT